MSPTSYRTAPPRERKVSLNDRIRQSSHRYCPRAPALGPVRARVASPLPRGFLHVADDEHFLAGLDEAQFSSREVLDRRRVRPLQALRLFPQDRVLNMHLLDFVLRLLQLPT